MNGLGRGRKIWMTRAERANYRGEFVVLDDKGRIDRVIASIWKVPGGFVLRRFQDYSDGVLEWESAPFHKNVFRRVGTLDVGYAVIPQFAARVTEMKELSERAALLLAIVDASSDVDWSTGAIRKYFVPASGFYYYRDHGKPAETSISGAGDAAALLGLERRGLIKRPKTTLPNKYVYVVTEDGRKFLEENGISERYVFA